MKVLGIETATDVCSVGLSGENGLHTERSVIDKHIHSEKLLSLIRELLDESRTSPEDLGAVAVSIGPGSFTGLRIGLSGAKGLCFAVNRPLVTVPTFQGIAHAIAMKERGVSNILVALDAKKGDFYSSTFSLQGGVPEETSATVVITLGELGPFKVGKTGLVVTDRPELLQQVMGGLTEVRHVHRYCSGLAVSEVGLRRLNSGQTADVRSVEPAYLKDFVARGKASTAH